MLADGMCTHVLLSVVLKQDFRGNCCLGKPLKLLFRRHETLNLAHCSRESVWLGAYKTTNLIFSISKIIYFLFTKAAQLISNCSRTHSSS